MTGPELLMLLGLAAGIFGAGWLACWLALGSPEIIPKPRPARRPRPPAGTVRLRHYNPTRSTR